ncbi:MAG: monovalent cation/H+ antiporter subunit D family protein, partial [bacterium]
MTYETFIPLYAVLVSLAAVPLILLFSDRPRIRETWTIGASLVKFGLVLILLPGVLAGRIAVVSLGEIVPGAELALKVDPLGMLFALVASSLWILTSFYSIGYVKGAHEKKQTRYFASFAVCLSATIGVAFAANIITFIL